MAVRRRWERKVVFSWFFQGLLLGLASSSVAALDQGPGHQTLPHEPGQPGGSQLRRALSGASWGFSRLWFSSYPVTPMGTSGYVRLVIK